MRVEGLWFRDHGVWFIGTADRLALPDLTVPLGFPATRFGMFSTRVEGPGSRVEG